MTKEGVPQDFEAEVEELRLKAMRRIDAIPVAALIWGPAPDPGSAIASARLKLRDELTKRGHLANFSEDLMDSNSRRSILAQQVAHAEAYDIVFSIPASPGSVAEIHDFARIPWLSHKIVTFLNRDWNDGYANQSLLQLQSTVTCQVQLYDPAGLPNGIIEIALNLVSRLQELYYIAGRRY